MYKSELVEKKNIYFNLFSLIYQYWQFEYTKQNNYFEINLA